jgi:hypothetical protein
MSYRYRFAKANKEFVNKILGMSVEELIAFTQTHNPDAYEEIEDTPPWFNCWNIFQQEEIFDFGDCPVHQAISNSSKDLFERNQKVGEYFSENEMRMCDKNTLLQAIDALRALIASHFKELAEDENAARAYCHKRAEDWMLISEIFSEFNISESRKTQLNSAHYPYDIDEDSDGIVQSGLYEYAIFELVYIYKTFDWENNYLLFYGW